MNHKLWYDEKTNVIYMESFGDLIESDIPEIKSTISDLVEGKKYRQMIVKLSTEYKVENRKTRELASKSFNDAGISEIAIVGGSAANRMVARVLIKTGAMKNQGQFFKTTDEAIKWLQSKR